LQELESVIEELNKEIKDIKEEIKYIMYKPHEWFSRNRTFYDSFMNKINQKIAEEVRQGLMLHIIHENPKKVAELVKNVVEDYLEKWEIDDQIAEQIVLNVISKPEFFNKLLRIILPHVSGIVSKKLMQIASVADDVLEILNEVNTDVLEEKARGND